MDESGGGAGTAAGGADPAAIVAAHKAALRDRMKAVRASIPEDERASLAGRVTERLFALPELAGARTVMVFSSFGSEIDTGEIAGRLLLEGRRVLLPFLQGRDMEAAELRPGEGPVRSAYGPKEPPDRAPVDSLEIDAVVVPGLAFDRDGYRVGYGGGHYDRYLVRLRPGTPRIGIAFHVQIVEAVPRAPGDEPVTLVVTDRETIRCG